MGAIIKWVKEVPPRTGGNKGSRWESVVDELLKNPGRTAKVFTGQSPKEAEAARNTLASHARSRAAEITTHVRQNDVYATAKERK